VQLQRSNGDLMVNIDDLDGLMRIIMGYEWDLNRHIGEC